MKALIFDIKKFSVHDGGGIRTTVFFKGCPLRCGWCHNPEGLTAERRLVYYKSRCIGCGRCLELDSGKNNIVPENGEKRFSAQNAADWAPYIEACPAAALVYDSRYYDIGELMDIIREDKPFYRYGGGVTLSGGEVFSQFDFAAELLRACEAEGIHTAIETSAYADKGRFAELADLAGAVFADFKIFDDALHRRHTGVSNERIKENIGYLLRSAKRDGAIIRTPLIPGFTGDLDNIRRIAGFISDLYPDVNYELLNYNPLALSKYELYGMDFCYETNPPKYTEAQLEVFRQAARDGGVKNLIC